MSQSVRRTFVVTNEQGLHMRPLQAFVAVASRVPGLVFMGRVGGEPLNGKSVLHLLGLAAERGAEVFVQVDGEDAEQAIDKLLETLQKSYDD